MELKPGTDQGTPRRSDLDEPQRPLTPLRVSSRRPQGTGADASSPALAETTIMATGVSPLSTPAIQDSDGPFLNGRTMSPSLSATSAGSSRPSRPTSPSRKRKVSERALGFLRRSAQLLPKVEQAREVEKASSGAPSKQGQGLSYQVRLQKGASSDRQKARGDDAQDPASSGVAAGPVTQEAVEAIPHSVSSEPSQTPDRTSALMAGWSTEMRETTSASAQSVPGHPDTGTGAPPSSQTQARQENDSLQARLQALVSTPSAPQAAKTEAHSTSMMSDATRASHADSEKAPPEGKELDSSFGIERKPRRASASHLSINTTGSDLSAGLNMPKRGPAALSSALSTPHLSSADRTTAALSQAADGGSRTALRKLVTTATTATTPPTARLQAHQRRVSIVPASTDPAPAVGATPVVPPDGALDVPIASASGVAESTPLGPMPDELPKQRPGIKVRIITWNMHDSLPKGDLEVLLGRVGAYVPPEEGWDVSYESDSEAEEEEEEEAETEGSQTAPAGENDERHQRSRPGKGKGVIGQEQVPRKDRIPPLPHNKDHPYHLVVVAGQECPWGDGRRIATGVGMAGELGDIARTKSKAVRDKPKPEKKEGEGLSSRSSIGDLKVKDHAFPPASPLNGTPAAPLTPGWNVAQGAAASGFPFGSSSGQAATTPGLGPMSPSPPDLPPPTPGGGLVDGFRENLNLSAGWGLSGKGWSDMCEDWLCRGPAAQAQATKFGIRRELSPVPHSPMPSGSDPVGANGQDHGLHEDVSLPSSPSPFLNSGGPKLKLRTDNLALKKISQSGSGHSPAARSEDHSSAEPSKTHELRRASVQGGLLAPPPTFTRNNSSSTLSEKSAKPDASPSPSSATAQPGCPDLSNQPRSSSPLPFGKDASENVQHHGWHLHGAHVHSPDSNPAAIGPYELLIKERMMGCYLAVYVWRGCRDRVRGVSRAHVKSGLLAGRVGNKGAVGISVKLGGTRMLFVNGHLAAHEGRVAVRLANVAKIKAELKVDTFLPADDPRQLYEDITEKFDHCFWFGDLNFRIDISRQHADWLLMQKRYDQALEFDQLRKVLREGEAFRGFEEAPIHFPPTYKYDVLKTLKAKRHKTVTRRILHRRAGSKGGDAIEEQAASARGCSADQVDLSQQDAEALRASNAEIMVTPDEKQEPKSLDGQGPEWGRVRRAAAARMRNARAAGVDKGAAQSEDDTSSVSSAWESFASVGFPHQLESDSDEPPASAETGAASPIPPADPVVASNTAAAQGRKVFSQGAAIKAKLRLLELVKTATGAKERETSSPVAPSTDMTRRNSRRRTRDSTSTSPEGRMPREYPMSPSQTVLPGRFSSKVATTDSANPSDTVPFDASLMDAASTRSSISSNFTMPALPLTSKAGSPSRQRASLPPPAKSAVGPVDIVKRGGGIRQKSLDIARKDNGSNRDDQTDDSTAEELSTVQPYDTSAKQRVPSWCDRILWRSLVPTEEEEPDESAHEGFSSRVGTALSNALLLPAIRHAARRDSAKLNSATVTFAVVSPQGTPRIRTASERPNTPEPKRPRKVSNLSVASVAPISPSKRHHFHRFFHRRAHGERFAIAVDQTTGEATPVIASSTRRSLHGEQRALSALDLPSQLRETANGTDRPRGSPEAVLRRRAVSASTSPVGSPDREHMSASVVPAQMTDSPSEATPPSAPSSAPSSRRPTLIRALTSDRTEQASISSANLDSGLGGVGTGRRTSWWADHFHLPSFLTPHGAAAALASSLGISPAPTGTTHADEKSRLVGPKRGHVECLLYKSLDDREMRILEGRSDHRPVVFVAAVGV